MDKPRTNKPRKKGPIYIALAIVGAAVITLGLSRLKPAPPSIDRAVAYMDTVRQATAEKAFMREVRGPGTLVPEVIRIVPAITAGRVDEIFARPGTAVVQGTDLLRLSNPDVMLLLVEAERELTAARSGLVSLQATLRTQVLSQQGVVAQTQTLYNEAVRAFERDQSLVEKNLISQNEASTSRDLMQELEARLRIEKEGLEVLEGTIDSQLEAQAAQVDRLTQLVALRQNDLESMNVKAPTDGMLQMLDLEIGQWVNPGIELARVVQLESGLKAELRIPETQAVDVVVGQTARIDTRNGIVQGSVVRIDPAALNGTVGVDVALPDKLPPGARPDLSVDGTIEIQRLTDVLYVARPHIGNANQTVGLFKLMPDGQTAERVTVAFGTSSVNHIEVKSGLSEGDVVLLSDMSQWDEYDRVRLR
jgi:multidrug resistance efflux pump